MGGPDPFLEPGVLVMHPTREDWGLGQVQSVAGGVLFVAPAYPIFYSPADNLALCVALESVRPGDVLSVRATVVETRRSKGKAGLGILRWRWQLHNQQGQEVLDLEATSLFSLYKAIS